MTLSRASAELLQGYLPEKWPNQITQASHFTRNRAGFVKGAEPLYSINIADVLHVCITWQKHQQSWFNAKFS